MNLSKIIDFVIQEMTKNKKHLTYHNKNHILDCLSNANHILMLNSHFLLRDYKKTEIDLSKSRYKVIRDNYHTLNMPISLFLAICFHDIHYEIGDSKNEENSAINMYSYICENCQTIMYDYKDDLDLAYEMIIGSKHHDISLIDKDKDIYSFFFDIDMSYFSLEKKDYLKTIKLIMKEYVSKYSKEEYINGRIQFLKEISKSDIFSSSHYESYNMIAKENINEELAYLDKLK